MQAIVLAAGMGSRLKDLTKNKPKCMVSVNGRTIIERMLSQLDCLCLSRIVIVIGYAGDILKRYVDSLGIRTPVVYVTNEAYKETNNIYSLYLARNHMEEEDSLLLESDLVFESEALETLLEEPAENMALVARYENWMEGTVVTIDSESMIIDFIGKKEFNHNSDFCCYKTVNLYKVGSRLSSDYLFPEMKSYMEKNGKNDYYEMVFKRLRHEGTMKMKAAVFEKKWYEIDNAHDLQVAETVFAEKGK